MRTIFLSSVLHSITSLLLEWNGSSCFPLCVLPRLRIFLSFLVPPLSSDVHVGAAQTLASSAAAPLLSPKSLHQPTSSGGFGLAKEYDLNPCFIIGVHSGLDAAPVMHLLDGMTGRMGTASTSTC